MAGGVTRGRARPYHHGNLAAALLDAAMGMAAEGGPDAVVLREVARRVGVSPTAAYRHFDGQAGLTEAVKEAALERLAEHMRRALARADGGDAGDGADGGDAARPGTASMPIAGVVPLPGVTPGSAQERAIRRLEAVGRAYFDFALTEPGLFRSFCIGLPIPGGVRLPERATPPPPSQDGDHPTATEPAFGVLVGVLDDLVTTGVISAERRAAQVDIALWSAVHGLSVLCLDGPLAELPRSAQYSMLSAVTDVIFHGLAGPTG